MAIQRFNAVGGYSTGITATAVIDAIGNITGVGATFSGAVTIPLNTAPALTIGNHSSKNLVMSSIDGDGLIEQGGNSTATLTVRQASGGSLTLGGGVNSTFVVIDDSLQYIQIQNTGAVYIGDAAGAVNGTYLTIDDSTTSINAVANIFNVTGVATVAGRLDANAGISAAGGVTFSGTVASDTGYRITSNAIKALTGTTYTFIAADNGDIVTFNNGSTITVTVPTGLPVGFNCTAIQLGTGAVGFTAASGVTLNAYSSAYKIAGQHGSASLISYATNIFNLSGSLNP